MSSKNDNGKKRRKGTIWKILLVLVVIILAVRIALPYVLLDQANKRLKEMPGYYGHIDDLSLAILRGAYQIHSAFLDKQDTTSGVRSPFVAVDNIDLALEWEALFNGRIAGQVILDRPMVRFTKDEVEPKEVAQDTTELADLFEDFMPIEIERFEIRNGSFQFRDPTTSPEVFLAMEHIELVAEGLTTEKDTNDLLPGSVRMNANVYGGTFDLDMGLDPIASSPTFDMAVRLENADMTLFNEFFQAYGNFDIQQGRISLFTEIASNQGKFIGYVKPVIEDLQVLGPKDRDKPLGEQIWQGLVALGTSLIRNPNEQQIATRVPLEGDLEDPNVLTWYAVVDLLRNAFIKALEPQLDRDINIGQVDEGHEKDERGFFKRLFGGDKEKDK